MKRLLHGWSLILTLGLLTGMTSCSKDDAEAPATVNVGQSTLSFAAFAKDAQTITVDANYDWTFTVTGDTQICEVTREEGSNTLTVTPNINYDNVAHTAQIVITAGEGSSATSQTITVTQAANGETYLNFYDNAIESSNNPIITIDNNPDGGATLYELQLSTNNKLTIAYSDDQTDASEVSLDKKGTRVEIEGCDWITYEINEEETVDGVVTVLTLACSYNEDTENSRTAFLDVVSGAGTRNKVVRKHIGITQLADKPTIIINAPEAADGNGKELVATYDQSEPITFSVAANVKFTYRWIQNQSWVTLKETSEEGGNGKTRNFSLEFSEWTGTADRVVQLSFASVNGADEASADVWVRQTAAPQAAISLNMTNVVFNNGEESNTKYVEAECSFSSMDITATDLETQAEASWLNVTYDASLKALAIKVTGATEKTRSAKVDLYCGGNGNEASASLTVTQLGTAPSLELDKESIQLDSKGTAQVVSVMTNQADWEVVDATATTDFTITVDKQNKTITVSGSELSSGLREHTYTVKAGDIEKKLTVSQKVAYKVGDPYMVNGKPVGIVYKVDEAGIHGKAYALTVYNMGDKFFCFMRDNGFRFDDTNSPLSSSNGKANQELIKTIPEWETTCQATKWTVDLAEAQGVDWYIPAIDELKEMVEVMSNAKYYTSYYEPTKQYFEVLPDIDQVNDAWNVVRGLYKKYTTPEYGYDQEQYVIFQWGDDENNKIDGHYETQYDQYWNPIVWGDETGAYWYSSTIKKVDGYNRIMMIKFGRWMGNGVITDETYAEADWIDTQYSGSIHPICQF